MDDLHALFQEYWPHLIFAAGIIASATAATHAAMTKQDVRAAIAWVGVILLSPIFGSAFYLIAGINRVRHSQLQQQRDRSFRQYLGEQNGNWPDVSDISGSQFDSLCKVGNRVSRFPLRSGNAIALLCGGDETYPAMVQAIDGATRTIALQSYIFDKDRAGLEIAQALLRARERGVEIRVLIDAVGAKYSHPPINRWLRKHGIRTALFMTNPLGLRMPYANLRSHRKILVIDGRIGFTGGMNIREGFVRELAGTKLAKDTHFRLEGPVAQQLLSVFAHDWEFTTHEILPHSTWYEPEPGLMPANIVARCIQSGPDRTILSTHHLLLGAFAVAQRHIRIQSPYFLPDLVLAGALNTAARRGITVDIVIPGKNNLRLVNYAMTAQLDQFIRNGCRVWRQNGNFNHSKLLTIDEGWSLMGSSNMDPRSLRLNFELDVEIYDPAITAEIARRIDADIADSVPLTLDDLAAIPFRKRLRNRIIWLASPYL